MKIKVATKLLDNESFSQETTVEDNGTILSLMKFIVETRDEQVKKALIEIGWQPPKEI